jgi:hypothetical protein
VLEADAHFFDTETPGGSADGHYHSSCRSTGGRTIENGVLRKPAFTDRRSAEFAFQVQVLHLGSNEYPLARAGSAALASE